MTQPKTWANADQLDGYDFVDKAELVGEPFRITSIEMYHNNTGILFANVQAEKRNGDPFAFNDSSTGVLAQLSDYLTKRLGLIDGETPTEGTVYPVSLVAPRGLRVSVFGITKDSEPVSADDSRAVRKARTYYLTTSGMPKTAETPADVPAMVGAGGVGRSESAPPKTRGSRAK